MKLLIADDEIDVREGIRFLLDWADLGFIICGEGKNGADTLEQILKLQPDIVLLDIRMPKLSGLEVVRQAQEGGFLGKFIILSGYSDFAYAQEAIHLGVTSYLTKPIEEEELKKAVLEAKESILKEQQAQKKFLEYRDKARDSILKDILYHKANYPFLDYQDLMLESSVFQVVLYTQRSSGNVPLSQSNESSDFTGFLVYSLKTSDKVVRYGENNQVEFSEHPTVVQRGNERTINLLVSTPDVA